MENLHQNFFYVEKTKGFPFLTDIIEGDILYIRTFYPSKRLTEEESMAKAIAFSTLYLIELLVKGRTIPIFINKLVIEIETDFDQIYFKKLSKLELDSWRESLGIDNSRVILNLGNDFIKYLFPLDQNINHLTIITEEIWDILKRNIELLDKKQIYNLLRNWKLLLGEKYGHMMQEKLLIEVIYNFNLQIEKLEKLKIGKSDEKVISNIDTKIEQLNMKIENIIDNITNNEDVSDDVPSDWSDVSNPEDSPIVISKDQLSGGSFSIIDNYQRRKNRKISKKYIKNNKKSKKYYKNYFIF